MAIASLLLLLLLNLLCFGGKSHAYVGNASANDRHYHGLHTVKVASLLPATTCSRPTSTQGLEDKSLLEIVHRHGPCSNLFLHKEQEESKTATVLNSEEFLSHDRIRVKSLHFRISKKSKKSKEKPSKAGVLPVNTGLSLGTGNYIVRVGFGTPVKSMSVVFDTGSDLTWIQCKPCVRYCYEQQEPIFNPAESISYSNVTCNTTECSQLKSATSVTPTCGSSSNCIYGIQYGDQSFSVGYFARETLTLAPSNAFKDFQFGCGQNNRGLFGKAAGLLGLGRNKLSLVSQASRKYGGRFSYCLPSTSGSTGYLSFGAKPGSSSSVKFTPMVTDSREPSFYFLDMTAISVGGEKLQISASVFASSGTIIDSGTVITRLPQTAYTSLKSAFQEYMSSYPSAKPYSILDTCFNLTGYDEVKIPKISLYFKGEVALDVDPSGILIAASSSQVCLAFAGNDDDKDVGIIGNKQQQKMEVTYDVVRNKLGFGPGNCK